MAVIHYYFSTKQGMGMMQRIKNIDSHVAHRLSDKQIEVAVCTIKDYKFYQSDEGKRKLTQYVDSRHLFFIPYRFVKLSSFLYSLFLAYYCWKYKPDFLIGETSSCYRGLNFYKKFSKKTRLIVDFHGAYPEEYVYRNPTNYDKKTLKIAEDGEKMLVNNADYIICQSDEMKNHLVKKYGADKSLITVYKCGVDINLFKIIKKDRLLIRNKLGIDNEDFVFVYSGGMHRWQRIEDSLDIFKKYHQHNSKSKMLVLTRDTEGLNSIINRCHCDDINDSIISVSLQQKEVPAYLNAADIAFLMRENVVMNAVASPTKLGEYMACGLPVISNEVARKWVTEKGMQYLLLIDNVDDINDRIDNFVKSVSRDDIRQYAIDNLSIEIDNRNIDEMIEKINKCKNIL